MFFFSLKMKVIKVEVLNIVVKEKRLCCSVKVHLKGKTPKLYF